MEEYPPLTFCETINTTNFNAFTLAQIANTIVSFTPAVIVVYWWIAVSNVIPKLLV